MPVACNRDVSRKWMMECLSAFGLEAALAFRAAPWVTLDSSRNSRNDSRGSRGVIVIAGGIVQEPYIAEAKINIIGRRYTTLFFVEECID